MDASAEQLVLDYLSELADAAQRILRPDERLTFMARSRAAIARQIGETRVAETPDVRRLLGLFGDPEKLAAQERQRLDDAAPAGQSSGVAAEPSVVEEHSVAGERGTAAGHGTANGHGVANGHSAANGHGESVRSGAFDLAGGPVTPASASATSPSASVTPANGAATPANGSATSGGRSAASASASAATRSAPGGPVRAGPGAVPLTSRPFAMPTPHRPVTARWRPGKSGQLLPWERSSPDLLALDRDIPERPPWNRALTPRPAATGPLGLPAWWSQPTDPGDAQLDDEDDELGGITDAVPDLPEGWPAATLTLARRHPLEVAAILLIAAGVLVYPFPLWLFGVLIIGVSRLWDIKDKFCVLAVPIAVTLLGGVLLAGMTAKSGNLAGFAHALRIDGWNLIRVGVLFSAIYLGWRVRRGPRPRRLPSWYRTPHA
jgi:hypothetical protein